MPLPKPKKNEKDEVFIGRCLGDQTMIKEYPNKTQRMAVCKVQLKYKPKNEKNKPKKSKTKRGQSKNYKGQKI